MDSLDYPQPAAQREAEYVDLQAGGKHRPWTWAAWAVCVLLMAGMPLALFVRSTGHLRFVISLMSFVLTYAVLMGYLASKNE